MSCCSRKRCPTQTAAITAAPMERPNGIEIIRISPPVNRSMPGMNAIMPALSTMTAKIVVTHWSAPKLQIAPLASNPIVDSRRSRLLLVALL